MCQLHESHAECVRVGSSVKPMICQLLAPYVTVSYRKALDAIRFFM